MADVRLIDVNKYFRDEGNQTETNEQSLSFCIIHKIDKSIMQREKLY